jgi:glyoxylase-like metal-dependent hydrolase (beta-lactamase superfamily II)
MDDRRAPDLYRGMRNPVWTDLPRQPAEKNMFLRQLQVGPMAVFAYIVGDEETGDALVIDPAAETDRIIAEARKNKLNIRYIVNTHGHVDHVSGNADMKRMTDAKLVIHEKDAGMLTSTPAMVLSMFQAKASPAADILVREGDSVRVGSVALSVLHTPGHTPGGMSLYTSGYVFTGDTLFVEAVGRTDLPGGSWSVMVKAIQEKLYTLPDDTIVLPGHNYGRVPSSTIGNEKRNNLYVR